MHDWFEEQEIDAINERLDHWQRTREVCACGHTYGRHYDLGGCHECGCTEPFYPVSTVERKGE
jgi:hypothetical protein